MYTFDSRVRYSEVGTDGNMTLIALLDYFQDCSTFHSEDIGLGTDYLRELNQVWMLSAWQICVNRYPHLSERIVIGTAPYDFKGFIGYRNFVMKTKEGEVLSYANTIWSLMDLEKMAPAKPSEKMLKGYVLEEKYPMEYAPRKIVLPKDFEYGEAFPVRKYHIDTNEHVNNCQYVQMAMEELGGTEDIRQLRVEYKKSAVYGDIIYPKAAFEEDRTVVELCDEEGKIYAVVEFKVKNE